MTNTANPAPRAYTPEEARELFFRHLDGLARYWANETRGPTELGRMEGLVFSILVMFDGCTMGMPAMDIHLSPHPNDQEYHRKNGENWFEPGQVINDCSLHDEWCEWKRQKTEKTQ